MDIMVHAGESLGKQNVFIRASTFSGVHHAASHCKTRATRKQMKKNDRRNRNLQHSQDILKHDAALASAVRKSGMRKVLTLAVHSRREFVVAGALSLTAACAKTRAARYYAWLFIASGEEKAVVVAD